MKITRPKDALIVHFDLPTAADEQWFLLRSDVHFDNPKSDRKMERRHLDQARERNARVFDFGDLFDAMQGPRDPRSDRNIIRSEEGRSAYFNYLMDEAVDFYSPYADLFGSLSWGNHETAPLRHYGIDLTAMLISRLKDRTGHDIHHMPYSGFIRFRSTLNGTKKGAFTLRYTHGSGGGGPVTRGVIKHQRFSADYDADMYYIGHVHERSMMDRPQQYITRMGEIRNRTRWCCIAPGYKDASKDGNSWEQSVGLSPKPLGALWLRFRGCPTTGDLIATPSWAD
jgi:hypothetical protein